MVLKHSGGNLVCFPNVNKKFYMVSAMRKGKVTRASGILAWLTAKIANQTVPRGD
jgi:hypothetical protein